jgi:hypothetical protein
VRSTDLEAISGTVDRRIDSSMDLGVPTLRSWTTAGGL